MSLHDGTQTAPIPVRDLLARLHVERLVASQHRLNSYAARRRASAIAPRRPSGLTLTRSATRHLSLILGTLGLFLGFAVGMSNLLDDPPHRGYVKACISCHGAAVTDQPAPSVGPS